MRLSAAGAAAVGAAPMATMAGEAAQKPNILFLLTDDQAYHLLGYMGNKQVKTPNFDRLAAEGVVFNAHYDTTSICMASRATIATGQYEYRSGCNFNRGSLERIKWNRSYPVLLREAGYYTGFAGKFGFSVTDGPGKTAYHSNENMPMDSFDVWRGWPGQGKYNTAENEFVAEYAEKHPHSSAALGAVSRAFVKNAVKRNQPFCLSVSFKAPHLPLSPDSQYDDVYANTVWEEPPNYDEKGAAHLPRQAKSGRQYLSMDQFRPDSFQTTMRKYNQLIHGVDQAIGEIRAELEEQGVADNTVIILTSDNGYNCGAHGFSGKVLPYEEGSRAPLIVYDPRHPSAGKGHRCAGVTGNIDIMPTILDFAGVSIPDDVDGTSLRPMLDNPKKGVRDALAIMNVWGNIPTHELSIVTEKYKYLNWFFAGEGMKAAEELYDMKSDLHEMKNLIDDPKKQAVLKTMRAFYDREVERWKKNCVRRSGYPEWGILLDRSVPWEEKAKIIPEKEIRKYRDAVSGKGASM